MGYYRAALGPENDEAFALWSTFSSMVNQTTEVIAQAKQSLCDRKAQLSQASTNECRSLGNISHVTYPKLWTVRVFPLLFPL